MPKAGQIVLFRFPLTDLRLGKLRPALIIKMLPGQHDDWLICMISSQLHHEIKGVDNIMQTADADFVQSGLKAASLIRTSRLAVINATLLAGAIGEIDNNRLEKIKANLATWLTSK